MKIKRPSFRREKRVYYFDHRNGVLENKRTSRLRALTSSLMALFIVGGAGALTMHVLEQRQSTAQTPTLQRQSAPISTTQKSSEEDKLKDVTLKAREDEQLAKDVKSKLKNIPGGQKWSVYIRDLKSDRMASINADAQLTAPGLSNLFLAIPLEAKSPSKNWSYKYGKTTLANCVESVVSAKDTNCLPTLKGASDMKNANNLIANQGFKKTQYTDKEQSTSARDAGDLLFRLQNGQVLSDKARRVVFDGLYRQKMREGVPKSCGATCLVANIATESGNIRQDAAIVTDGDTKYVVVIMTNGGSWSQIAGLAGDIHKEMKP